MLVFVDTGAWIALALRKDPWHAPASDHFRELLTERAGLVTSNYVLSEAFTRLRYDGGHHVAVKFGEILDEALEKKVLSVQWIDAAVEKGAREIFVRYSDQVFPMTDCTSFVICRELRIDRVFGFDRDFEVMGLTVEPGMA